MDLYYLPVSSPCRSVLLTAKALGLELNKIEMNVLEGEQMKEEFLAINPQHCIPTLVDGDLSLWESRAICQYLVNQYAEEDTLYPKEPKTRAKIDFLLDFDLGTLFKRCTSYIFPILGGAEADDTKLEKVQEALGWLNSFLEGQEYLVGENITIADFVLVASVSTAQECGIDLSEHANIEAWLERCKENMEGYEEENAEGAVKMGEYFKSKLE